LIVNERRVEHNEWGNVKAFFLLLYSIALRILSLSPLDNVV